MDAGAFIAVERRVPHVVGLLDRAAKEKTRLVTSAGVVAQVWRGGHRGQAPIVFLLRRTEVLDLTYSLARRLGQLLGRCEGRDAIDAHVAYIAAQRDWPVLTSDPDDILAIDPSLVVERV